ncbi:MAG: hypothetical protein GYA58_12505 [Anaerolineaceae bacterium]|jgi:hypothetical protein|nr:hypothetical protein [Anaerolineaceae bacterium]
MKHSSNKRLLFLFTLLLAAAFMLAACNGASSGSSTSEPSSAAETDSALPAATTAAPSLPGDCLIGSWSLTDFSSYMASIQQNLSSASGNDVTFSSGDFSGSATWTFNADNTAVFSAENFQQNMTMHTSVNDTVMDIPISININGSGTGKYAVEDDKISFSDQDNSSIAINIDVMGTASTIDQSLMGESGTTRLYQYTCSGDTLSLKVIAVENMDLAPLTLTRIH